MLDRGVTLLRLFAHHRFEDDVVEVALPPPQFVGSVFVGAEEVCSAAFRRKF